MIIFGLVLVSAMLSLVIDIIMIKVSAVLSLIGHVIIFVTTMKRMRLVNIALSLLMMIRGRLPCQAAREGAMAATQSSHSALGWRAGSALGWRAGSAPSLGAAPSGTPGCLSGSGPSSSGILCRRRGIPCPRGSGPTRRGIPQSAPVSGVALGRGRGMQPRAPRGGGGGSRPGNVWFRTWRRQFITTMISLL